MLNGPEARHGTVINAVRRAGHALRHSCLHELVVKCPVGILEPSVAMEQGVRVWIGFHGIFKGFVNQWIVIAFAEHIGTRCAGRKGRGWRSDRVYVPLYRKIT